MKLLAVVRRYVPVDAAGAEVMLHTILKDLLARGHEATVLTAFNRGTYTHEGVHVRPWARAPRLELAHRADVVVTHLHATASAVALAKEAGRPIVHLVHNDRPLLFDPDDADLVVFNTRWIAERFRPMPGANLVVHPPVHAADYATETTREKVTLLNLTDAKGGPLLANLARRCPDRDFLGVLGAYGTQHIPDPLPANLEVIDNTPNVVDDVYARTRVLLVPSAYESFGRVTLEAGASAIPVIAHPTAGLVEACGDAALWARREHPEEWVAALELLDNPSFYADRGDAMRRRLADFVPTFELDTLAQELERLVEKPGTPVPGSSVPGRRLEVLDARAQHVAYIEHLAPVWADLSRRAPELVGNLYAAPRAFAYAEAVGLPNVRPIGENAPTPTRPGPVLVASFTDYKLTAGRPIIMLEHGAGQSYGNRHSSYAGGRGRERVRLHLAPNEQNATAHRARYPTTPVAVVGCPKLDAYHGRPPKPRSNPPVVALSFHWDCQVAPEARSAWSHYAEVLPALAAVDDIELIGHGHPGIIDELTPHYEAAGIEVVRSFAEVLERADVYAVDNSSTLYEFAGATGRPVVVLNAPWYRRDVDHGLRFWEAATIGPQADEPDEVLPAIRRALEDRPEDLEERAAALKVAYAHLDGRASERTTMAILNSRLTSGRVKSCPVCGTADGACGHGGGESFTATIVEGPGVDDELHVAIYHTHQGDFRYNTRDAIARGLLSDGPDIVRPVTRRLIKAGATEEDLEELRSAYRSWAPDDRDEFLAALAMTRPAALMQSFRSAAAAISPARDTETAPGDAEAADGSPTAEETSEEPTEAEDDYPTDGRVGDVLAWVQRSDVDTAEEGRATEALARELARSKPRRTLLDELEKLSGP